jgi:hypothetical protein
MRFPEMIQARISAVRREKNRQMGGRICSMDIERHRKGATAMKRTMLPVLFSLIPLAGCADMSASQQRMLSGTTGGTAAGAAVGAIAGNAGLGAAIGAGTGLVGSYIYDKHKQSEQRAYEQGFQQGRQQQPQPQTHP